MKIWLVTVRALEGRDNNVREILRSRLAPLLTKSGCTSPAVAGCLHCAGEYTYLGYWRDDESVEAFERLPGYRSVLADLAPLLRVPPKRELWELLPPTPV